VSDLIREVTFGKSGLIREVTFGEWPNKKGDLW
jgi:hypothetical protein